MRSRPDSSEKTTPLRRPDTVPAVQANTSIVPLARRDSAESFQPPTRTAPIEYTPLPDGGIHLDISEAVRRADSAQQQGETARIECYFNDGNASVSQCFQCRLTVSGPASMLMLTIPVSIDSPGTLFILFHGPDCQILQLVRHVPARRR